jgi:hypothetical protein
VNFLQGGNTIRQEVRRVLKVLMAEEATIDTAAPTED